MGEAALVDATLEAAGAALEDAALAATAPSAAIFFAFRTGVEGAVLGRSDTCAPDVGSLMILALIRLKNLFAFSTPLI